MLVRNLVVEHRLLAHVAGPGDRQATARLDVAEQQFGHGLAALHARVGGPDNRVGRGCRRGQHVRLARDDNQNERLAGRRDGIQQGNLRAEQLERCGGATFAHELDPVTEHHDGHIGGLGCRNGLGDQLGINRSRVHHLRARLAVGEELPERVDPEREDVGSAGVGHRSAVLTSNGTQAVQHRRGHLARVAVCHPRGLTGRAGPVAKDRVLVVGVRTDHRDPLDAGSQRQHAVVLQQHQAAASRGEVELGVRRRVDHGGLLGQVGAASVLE